MPVREGLCRLRNGYPTFHMVNWRAWGTPGPWEWQPMPFQPAPGGLNIQPNSNGGSSIAQVPSPCEPGSNHPTVNHSGKAGEDVKMIMPTI
jgi:hypothetical protein